MIGWLLLLVGAVGGCQEESFEVGGEPPDGQLLREGPAPALDACLALCRSDTRCTAFAFAPASCLLYHLGDDAPPQEERRGWEGGRVVGRKVCMEGCGKPWAVERLPGRELPRDPRALSYQASSRIVCHQICLTHTPFTCRSANFYSESGECVVSPVDRWTEEDNLLVNESSEYIENNCAPDLGGLCQFSAASGRALAVPDSLVEGIGDIETCKNLCLRSKDFRCRSYDYGVGGEGICRMSHESRKGPLEGPYLAQPDAVSYHLASCYNVSIHCGVSAMIAKITTDKRFKGKVYAKTRPNSCVQDVTSDTDFHLDLGFNDLDCDVKQESPGKFTSDIIIQHHDQIVTEQDVGLSIKCSYSLGNRSVGQGVELGVGGGPASGGSHEASFVLSPTVTMTITDRNGGDVHTAQVGDPLSLRFGILEEETPYEIFVRELIALDGVDSSEILLIDSEGCPTDPTIMGSVRQSSERGVLEAPFDAFKFPTSDVVQFKALVTPCLPACQPVSCPFHDFFGAVRRHDSLGKRRRRRETDMNPREEVVVQSIEIRDKFGLGGGVGAVEREVVRGEAVTCSSRTSVALVVSLLLSAQIVLCFLSYTLCRKWRPAPQYPT